MIPKKDWNKYTLAEIQAMKNAVATASGDTPFSTEYAAAYLGKSANTLQAWRSRKTGMLIYSKIGGGVSYLKKDLDQFIFNNRRLSTTTAA